MVNYCCVPLCKGFGGLHFPKDKTLKDKWRIAVKKGIHGKKGKLWEPSKYDVVCHKHFRPEDFTKTQKGKRMRLKKGVIPSVFLERMPLEDLEQMEKKERRKERLEKRRTKMCTESSPPNPESSVPPVPNMGMEIEISEETMSPEVTIPELSNAAIQCEIPIVSDVILSVERFRNNPKAVKYYTGFDNYEHFMMFFTCLGPAVDHLLKKFKKMKPCEQLFITLIKLRQNKDDYEIGILFDISEKKVVALSTHGSISCTSNLKK